MGDFYGYNPAQYTNDFSWIGHMGDTISRFATQMPELLEMNKQIKENNKFKDISFSSANQFIDKLDKNQATKIAASLGLDYANESEARTKLKQMIPKYGEKTTNEEYAGQIVNSFFAPVMQHAMSDKVGSPLSVGDILTRVNNGTLQNAMANTVPGKQNQEEQQYQKGFQRQYGLGGEEQTKLGMQNQSQLDFEKQQGPIRNQNTLDLQKQQSDIQKQKGQQSAKLISQAINISRTPEQAYKMVTDNGGTEEDALQASTQIRERLNDELKRQELRDKFAKRVLDKKELETADPKTLPGLIKDAAKTVGDINASIIKLKIDKQKKLIDPVDYEQQLADLNIQLQTAKINQKSATNSYNFYLASGEKTKVDEVNSQRVGQASAITEENINNLPPLTGADTTNKNYNPTPTMQLFLNDVRQQLNDSGKISDPKTLEFGNRWAAQQGLSLPQLLMANGIKVGGSQSQQQSSNDSVDYRSIAKNKKQNGDLIEKAKAALTDSNATPTQKANAKKYLQDMGIDIND